jgi:hypothetical protein
MDLAGGGDHHQAREVQAAHLSAVAQIIKPLGRHLPRRLATRPTRIEYAHRGHAIAPLAQCLRSGRQPASERRNDPCGYDGDWAIHSENQASHALEPH